MDYLWGRLRRNVEREDRQYDLAIAYLPPARFVVK